jgi:hypothetical protein
VRSEFRCRIAAFVLASGVFLLGPVAAAAQDVIAPLPYPIHSHEEWWRMQYGASLADWTDKLGPDYRNRNSGPACVVMLLHYKKRAWIKSDFGSFADPEFPRIHADSRWKFCRSNMEKGYPGGFAEDDQAEVTSAELADVLTNEDLPAFVHQGSEAVTIEAIARILGQANLAVCRVDPSAYFPDERPGQSRWVVVFGIAGGSVILHDPGRSEGRSRSMPEKAFLEAVRMGGRNGSPVMIECLTMVGSYGDGWHADGRSRPFADAWRRFSRWIGRPDDPGGNFLVHSIETCVAQDFKQDLDKPHYGKTGASLVFLDKARLRAFWLKGEMYEKYMEIWGFRALGSPTSDERDAGGVVRQDFEKGRMEMRDGMVVVRTTSSEAPPVKK